MNELKNLEFLGFSLPGPIYIFGAMFLASWVMRFTSMARKPLDPYLSMRFIPIRPHAHLGQQGHLEMCDTGHQARDLNFQPAHF